MTFDPLPTVWRKELFVDILNIATESGLLVTLDGRIGCQEYRSVHGSIQALAGLELGGPALRCRLQFDQQTLRRGPPANLHVDNGDFAVALRGHVRFHLRRLRREQRRTDGHARPGGTASSGNS